eukprot:4254826-Pleurochrysis_carterae.AAC.1
MAAPASAGVTTDAACQERERPTFESLRRPSTDSVTPDYVESLAIGTFAPVYARDSVQQPWVPCVLCARQRRSAFFLTAMDWCKS